MGGRRIDSSYDQQTAIYTHLPPHLPPLLTPHLSIYARYPLDPLVQQPFSNSSRSPTLENAQAFIAQQESSQQWDGGLVGLMIQPRLLLFVAQIAAICSHYLRYAQQQPGEAIFI